jgi:metal-dependent amidase/aminoacylase/carboxypeptidase family protein
VHAGDAANAIPSTAVARGTIRAYDAAAREFLHRRLTAISYFAEKIPAVMLFVGASGNEMLHSPAFLPDDADLTPVATAMLSSYLAAAQVVGLAERRTSAYR